MATAPNQVWSWDITRKKWSYYYLYVILDIYSRYVVGWMVADRENSALAGRAAELPGGVHEPLGEFVVFSFALALFLFGGEGLDSAGGEWRILERSVDACASGSCCRGC